MPRVQDSHLPPVRGLLVCLLVGLAVLGLAHVVLPDLQAAADALASGHVAQQPFDVVLVWVCEAVTLATVAWLAILTVVVVSDAARGQDRQRTGCPRWLRRAILTACGVGVAVALTSPAHARPADGTAAGRPSTPAAMQGLAYPDRPDDSPFATESHLAPRSDGSTTRGYGAPATAEADPTPQPTPQQRHTHVIVQDDTLWDIAAQTLRGGASDAEIATAWQRIYADNADVLGPNPDLIHPGTVLRVPTA